MPFVLRLAWRETRAGWRHFVGLVACVALGVAALVGVGSFGASLAHGLAREGKALLGGDLELRSPRAFDAAAERELARLAASGATVTGVRELIATARGEHGSALLVELKAVGPGYPLYGRLATRPEGIQTALAAGGALVEEALLARLQVRLGDPLLIGGARFTIRGVVLSEPDRVGTMLALGPRVLVADADLPSTGLIQYGSRVRHRALVRLPASVPAMATRDALTRALDDPAIRVTAFDEAQPGLRRFFTQLTTYLGLVGLASLLVGAIGVAAAVRTFIRRKRETIAILKCLGASSRSIIAAYLAQSVALGLLGSVVGAALGIALQPLVARLLADVVPFTLEPGADGWAVARGVAMGALVTLLVALLPLGEIRTIPPSAMLRQEVAPRRTGRRWPLVALPVGAGLVALALWQAGSIKVGGIFVGGTIAALALLALIAHAVKLLAGRRPRWASLAWRQGVANLARPGGHAGGVVVALGIGVMLLTSVAVLEMNLGRQIDHERRREVPSVFFVDVQPDQRERLGEIVRSAGAGAAAELTPVVRARLAAVSGEEVTRAMVTQRRADGHEAVWYFTRDYVLTASATLPAGNVLTHGRWWTVAEAAERRLASLEEKAALYLGVGVGGTLTFDIQGARVEAEVRSLRRVDWQSFTTNFFVVLSPGALDGAPTTFVGTARLPAGAEGTVQGAVAAAFPNVMVLPVRDVLEQARAILGRIAFALRAVALFSIGAGLAVMIGSLTAVRRERLTESAILRTLGATRGTVARIFAVEYACLGAAAGLAGSLLASLLAWVVLRFVFDAPWALAPATLALGVAGATVTALAVGFLATFRLLGDKPFPVLRRE